MRLSFTPFLLGLLLFLMTTVNPLKADSLVLGGGCFWCTEAAYQIVPGVTQVTSGYAGGKDDNPTYHSIGRGRTSHAEVVKIDYDPSQVTVAELLSYFWHMHDATQVGGQGADLGPQYRSIILFSSPEQKEQAEASRDEEQKKRVEPVTTEILPLVKFWPAEDYHQDYFRKNPKAGYCLMVVRPKIEKIKRLLPKPKA